MNFQILQNGEIKNLILYKIYSLKKEEYIIRIINDKFIIREAKQIDYYKKIKEDYFSGNLNKKI